MKSWSLCLVPLNTQTTLVFSRSLVLSPALEVNLRSLTFDCFKASKQLKEL